MKQLLFLFLITLTFSNSSISQVSGDLMLNANFFHRDTLIGASNNRLYDNFLSGGESWINVGYNIKDFDIKARFDLFTNSNLHNPQEAYSDHGIGYWSIHKKVERLDVTIGSIYDQIGSGIIFRAYEDRGIGTDKVLQGIKLNYELSENWMIKGFTGRQKNKFTSYKPIIKGINSEKFSKLSDKINILTGIGLVNRTMDQTSMTTLVTNIEALELEDRFYPKYNVFAGTLYNTLYFGNINWYIEYAQKSSEAIVDEKGKLADKSGHIFYSSFTYSKKGIGATIQYKETEYFSFRTSPNEVLLDGVINFLPPLTKLNSLRLLARYPASALEWNERALQADIIYTPKKGNTFALNTSYATDRKLNELSNSKLRTDSLLFFEVNLDYERTVSKKLNVAGGMQYINYNQQVYQFKPGVPMVVAVTPFAEFSYKIKKRNSLRGELQYMHTKQDFGSWAFALLEYNIAPMFSFAILDMYNIHPKKTTKKIHYPTVFMSYTKGANRFTLSYVKQVEGVVCTGGICRLEPAFSGIKFTITSTF